MIPLFGEKYLTKAHELYKKYLNLMKGNTSTKVFSRFYIIREKSGTPIGSVSIDTIDRKTKTAFINYFIDSKHKGKGIGFYSVLYAINDFMSIIKSSNLNIKYLYANVHQNNDASQALIQKAGFKISETITNEEGDIVDKYMIDLESLARRLESGIKSNEGIFDYFKKKKAEKENAINNPKIERNYSQYQNKINYHTIFSIKHNNIKNYSVGTYKFPTGKMVLYDYTTLNESTARNPLSVPTTPCKVEISRLRMGNNKWDSIGCIRFKFSNNPVVKFDSLNFGISIDAGSVMVYNHVPEDFDKLEDEYGEEAGDVEMETDGQDAKIIKFDWLKYPIVYINLEGDGAINAVGGFDQSNKLTEVYFPIYDIKKYIDVIEPEN